MVLIDAHEKEKDSALAVILPSCWCYYWFETRAVRPYLLGL